MTATDPHLSKGTIAVDLDDVLCDTNQRVAEMHNEFYGTDMTVEDFDFCEHHSKSAAQGLG